MKPQDENLGCRPLPIEIWQKTASYMSLREWAQACGSCKSLFRLPLLKVDLTGNDEGIPAQGVCWALSRGPEMPVIHIKETDKWDFSGAFESIASSLSWVAANSTALQVLIVELYPSALDDYCSRHHQAPTTDHKNDWVHALAQQLATCRPQLRAFGCRARDLNTFPNIPNLKHLVLEVCCDSLQSGVESLAALKSLETLQLKGHGSSYAQDNAPFAQGAEPPIAFDCPPLKLSSLGRLRSLVVTDITPEGISVSSSCGVHVNLAGNHDVRHPLWSVICIDALRSISWFVKSYDIGIETAQYIPRAMREASCLDCVSICEVGHWVCEELPSALARVRVLTIESRSIIFCVPAKVQWQCIYLHGWVHFDVTFEDVGAFARMPMNFHFESSRSLRRKWLPLDAALVKSKPDWVSKAKQLTHECQCADKCKYNCSEYEISLLSYGKITELMRCACGACIGCLERDKKIVAV